MVGQAHRRCVERLSALRIRIDTPQRHLESQQPLVCTETHVPQPDFMVLRGALGDYNDLPYAADAFCVLEVADSSNERDAGEKRNAYAKAGIVQYVIINLRNRTAEVYGLNDVTDGEYPPPTVIPETGSIPLRIGDAEVFAVPLAELLA